MRLIQLSAARFKQLQQEHLSLDEVYLLEVIQEGMMPQFGERRITLILSGMKRKGLITEEDALTEAGKKLLESLFLPETEELKMNSIEKTLSDFEQWWAAFPRNDTVLKASGDELFPSTRSFRMQKEACKVKFHKILSEGKYTTEDLIRAVAFDYWRKVQESIKLRRNSLTFMQNSLTWLNNCGGGVVEDARKWVKPVDRPSSKSQQQFI